MAVIAIRGGKPLKLEELRSHLGLATRLENIAVLLGAGCSSGLGGETMHQVWQGFRRDFQQSREWLQQEGFLTAAEQAQPDTVNIESKLDVLAAAEQEWARQAPQPAGLLALRQHRANLYRSLIRGAILDRALWTTPEIAHGHAGLRAHRELLIKLVGNRQPGQASPWVFTTNFDLSVEWAGESLGLHVNNGFSGVHNRTFAPHNFDLGLRNVQARGEARFGVYNCYLAKLHGSLTWISPGGQVLREIPGAYSLAALDAFLGGGGAWPNVLIYPGASKYIQTTSFVYGELMRKFSEVLSRRQVCLVVCGYSFSDEHLNRVLMSALQNPTLHLILYTPSLTAVGNPPVYSIPNNVWLAELLALQLPQVTFVGSGADAYFASMVDMLPEPALFDDRSEQARRLMRAIEQAAGAANQAPQGGGNQAA